MVSRELLHNTLSIQSTSGDTAQMHRYIRRFARRIRNAVIHEEHGNMYITKGEADIYPCVVAHTDTVHDLINDFVVNFKNGVYSGKNRTTGGSHGVGGDDKAGIVIALQALKDFDTIKVAFFRDEEVGCVGSRLADMDFFVDCAFVLQADRRYNSDVVRSVYGTQLFDDRFSEAIRPFMSRWHFQETTGMLTDVYMLRRNGLRVASLNMSAGYYQPHTSQEIVVLADVEKSYGFVSDVIKHLGQQQWECAPKAVSQFSLFEEEEEEEEAYMFGDFDNDDEERIFIEAWMQRSGFHVDTCPMCGDNNVMYDDTVGGYFCMTCLDYIFIDEVVEV